MFNVCTVIIDYLNPQLSEVMVQHMEGQSTTSDHLDICTCTVNLRHVVALQEPAAVRLPS